MTAARRYARSTDDGRWSREPWAWFVVAVPVSAVCFGIVMIVAAATTPHALVRGDYYQAGLAINQDLSGQRAAAARNVTARVEQLPDRAGWSITVTRAGREEAEQLTLELIHPTLARQDLRQRLVRSGNGAWRGRVPALTGKRQLVVRPQSDAWRLRADIHLNAFDDAAPSGFTVRAASPSQLAPVP